MTYGQFEVCKLLTLGWPKVSLRQTRRGGPISGKVRSGDGGPAAAAAGGTGGDGSGELGRKRSKPLLIGP